MSGAFPKFLSVNLVHSIFAVVSSGFLANTILRLTEENIVSLNKLGMVYSSCAVYYCTAAQWNLDYMDS